MLRDKRRLLCPLLGRPFFKYLNASLLEFTDVLPHVTPEQKCHPVSGNFVHPTYSLSSFLPSKHFAHTELLCIS